MPNAPILKPCCAPLCGALIPRGKRFCDVHARAERKRRGAMPLQSLYSCARWRELRARFLAANPCCEACKAANPSRLTPATVCDHITPHKGDVERFWAGPFSALCASCHNSATARFDGGFGRPVQPKPGAGEAIQ